MALSKEGLIQELKHEIHSPLAAIRNALYLAGVRTDNPEALHYLALAEAEITRIATVLKNADQINLRKEFGDIRNELSKTLAPSPDREAALNFIEKSLETLRNTHVTPEYLVNFWQDINKTVKWNSIQGGKKALAQLKKPLMNALENTSPNLAKDFEMTNMLYSKYADISKKLKPNLVDAFVNKGEILAAPAAALSLIYGNLLPLTGLASENALRILSREMLINPYFQNVGTKLVKNFNQASLKGVNDSVKQVREYMERKHPNEDWSFLNED